MCGSAGLAARTALLSGQTATKLCFHGVTSDLGWHIPTQGSRPNLLIVSLKAKCRFLWIMPNIDPTTRVEKHSMKTSRRMWSWKDSTVLCSNSHPVYWFWLFSQMQPSYKDKQPPIYVLSLSIRLLSLLLMLSLFLSCFIEFTFLPFFFSTLHKVML